MSVRITNPQSEKLKQYRRDLRRHATKSEQILWKYIKSSQLGVKFRRQVSIGPYIVDFYCHEKRLVIELDGYTHQGDAAVVKDTKKQDYFVQNGYTVVRCTDGQVLSNMEGVIKTIQSYV